MRPKFSIVIPTIGRLDLIKRALYSALRQQDHFDDYEVVVLDNCSEDGTWEYLQSMKNNPRLKVFRNSQRLSQARNWNKAVRLSRGEFVYMLQDDNVVLPEMLATISNAMARYLFGRRLFNPQHKKDGRIVETALERFLASSWQDILSSEAAPPRRWWGLRR